MIFFENFYSAHPVIDHTVWNFDKEKQQLEACFKVQEGSNFLVLKERFSRALV